jgi:hypothetical protein
MFVFNVWETSKNQYMEPMGCRIVSQGMSHVPVYSPSMKLPDTIAEVLAMSDGQSALAPVPREGLVWKCEQDPSISFKAISNKWLLKEKD